LHQYINAIIFNILQRTEFKLEFNNLILRDQLTGLYNLRQLEEFMEREVALLLRKGGRLALLMIGLDGLKGVSDSFGSAASDEVLRTSAMRFSQYVRKYDTAGRNADDKFMLICPGVVEKNDARSLSERILAVLGRETHFNNNQNSVRLLINIGIALYPDSYNIHIGGVDDLIRVAEGALAAAKRSGQNCHAFALAN
jgi:diguanylate cyclase (GGDEF)-like protein